MATLLVTTAGGWWLALEQPAGAEGSSETAVLLGWAVAAGVPDKNMSLPFLKKTKSCSFPGPQTPSDIASCERCDNEKIMKNEKRIFSEDKLYKDYYT